MSLAPSRSARPQRGARPLLPPVRGRRARAAGRPRGARSGSRRGRRSACRDGTQTPQQRPGLRGRAPSSASSGSHHAAAASARSRMVAARSSMAPSRWPRVTGSLGTAYGLPARSRSSPAARSSRAAVAGTWPRGMNASGNMPRSSLAAAPRAMGPRPHTRSVGWPSCAAVTAWPGRAEASRTSKAPPSFSHRATGS